MVRGTLDGMPVQVLRDTGCTGLLVKRCLVNPTALTGDKRVLIKVDASQEEVEVARCNIQSPVFSGTVDMMCVPTMIYDVIVGNVPGAYPDLGDILPKVAPLVPERDGESEPTVSVLNKLKYVLPLHIRYTLYNSFVLPYLSYCVMIGGFQTHRLLTLQKRAIRTITLCKYNSHSNPLFKRLHTLKIDDLLHHTTITILL